MLFAQPVLRSRFVPHSATGLQSLGVCHSRGSRCCGVGGWVGDDKPRVLNVLQRYCRENNALPLAVAILAQGSCTKESKMGFNLP